MNEKTTNPAPEPLGVEAELERFLRTSDAEEKLGFFVPEGVRFTPEAAPRRIERPGRPTEWTVAAKSPRTPTGRALERPEARARLLHTFLHHELQAAELFAFAVLAFPGAPLEFREGLVRLCGVELEHLGLYRGELRQLGFEVGDFPVRDWLFGRGASVGSALEFVSLVGLGFEGANLDHSARFARWFREAGDEDGARVLERIGAEEEGHVAFAVRWFERLGGEELDYDRWCELLPRPLTPAVFRGPTIDRRARERAGLGHVFLDRLEHEAPTSTPRR